VKDSFFFYKNSGSLLAQRTIKAGGSTGFIDAAANSLRKERKSKYLRKEDDFF